ncbi:SRPBCC family protein [Cellulomonas fengjieae]|uniref:SRPBCC domain-containing protein n=1 Tax=Cellulomonas fengjieae TaxID=2819978 RepID=A0ABS3SH61_9CELL|nr:SRPBCC domain-containing protein [Cellulomonas fengjieae]MBO3084306.1 SRPBCC domain-containing protein [Cellulomonas fengjieae]QVI67344.1 SRPBCC domain-containing protein [Cellulomonas fengjieae]
MGELGEVLVRGARREVAFTRVLGAPPADVWAALTVPERVARWIGDLETSGDEYVLTFPDPGSPRTHGRVLVCEPTSRLVVTWTHETEAPGEVEIVLVAHGHGTELHLVHRDLQAVGAAEYGAGWHELLDVLADAVGFPVETPQPFADVLPRYRRLEAAGVAGEVTTGPDGATVVVSRLLDAAQDEVWSAFTRRERVARWLWPVTQWPGADDEPWEPAPGERIVFADPNVPGGVRFEVLEVQPQRRLAVRWGPADGQDGTDVIFTFQQEGDETLLVVHQGPSPEVEGAGRRRGGADFAAGWHALVDALTVLLSGEKMPPGEDLWEAAYAVYSAPGQPTVASL